MMIRKVAIVGAGASGLAAVKTCLEHDFDPICFEKSCDIGGWWNCQIMELSAASSLHPRVLHSTLSRNSKEFLAFSDFPPPKEFPTFLPQSKMMEYLRKYAQRFSLESHIQFNSEVLSITKAESYSENGRLIVTYHEKKSWRNKSETFDAVFLCTGHWTRPYIPDIPGLQEFDGKKLHSSRYTSPRKFEGRRVLVLGFDSDSVDISVDISRVASQVFLSTNGCSGKWLLSRFSRGCVPWDTYYLTNWNHFLWHHPLTRNYVQSKVEREVKTRYDHSEFGLEPAHPLFKDEPPIISDELVTCLHSGKIVLKPAVSSFQSVPLPFVLFEDGTIETGINSVILHTGYSLQFPSLGTLVSEYEAGPVLHNHIFPVELPHHTLALIGMVYPTHGGDNGFLISEIQCRYVCQVLTLRIASPIRRKNSMKMAVQMQKRRSHPYVHKVQSDFQVSYQDRSKLSESYIFVDFISHMKHLADSMGINPDKLYNWGVPYNLNVALLFKPFVAYRYRIFGPNRWLASSQTILELDSRTQNFRKSAIIPISPRLSAKLRNNKIVLQPKQRSILKKQDSKMAAGAENRDSRLPYGHQIHNILISVLMATVKALKDWANGVMATPQQYRKTLMLLAFLMLTLVFFAVAGRVIFAVL